MTKVVDAAYRLHDRQLEAATQVQDLVIKAVDGLAHLRQRAPQAPEQVAVPLQKITAPVVRAVGAPQDVTAYFARTTRDWIKLQRRFQDAIFKVGQDETEPDKTAPVRPVRTVEPVAPGRGKTTAKITNA